MPYPNVKSVVASVVSVTAAASGQSAPIGGFVGATRAVVQLHVTSAAGVTPTLDAVLEDTIDGTNWNTVATFAQATAAGRSVQRISAPFTDRLRVRYTIGGTTPSFTFSVQIYAES